MTIFEYENIVKNSSKKIFRIVFKITKDKDLTEDILQDVFLKLWEKRKTIDLKFAEGWLIKSARNKFIDYYRLKDNQTLNISVNDSIIEETKLDNKNESDYNKILKELEQLPIQQKEIFFMKEMEGLTIKEIANYLDITESKVKVTIHRIRKNIRNKYALIQQ